MRIAPLSTKCRSCILLLLFSLASMTLATAQEKKQPEKRWMRMRMIEVSRKSFADSILVQLRQGESFQKLARSYSIHSSATKGGGLGWMLLDDLDKSYQAAISSLPIGKYSEVIYIASHFWLFLKTNELAESDYLMWQQDKAQADSLLKKIEQLINAGEPSASVALIEKAQKLLERIDFQDSYLRLLGLKGMALSDLAKADEATQAYKLVLKLARNEGLSDWQEFALGQLGLAYDALSEYRIAIAYYDSALVIGRKIGDRQGEGTTLGNLGNAYRSLGQYKQAITYSESALVISREIGDRQGEGTFLDNIGTAYLSLGLYRQAIVYYISALVINRQISNRQGEGVSLGNLGNGYWSLGQYYKAIAYSDSALVISRKIGDRQNEGAWLGNLGNAYLSLDQYLQAIAYYDSALVICREIGNRDGEGTWLGNLGNTYQSLGQYKQAIAYCDSALVISRHISDRAGEGRHLGNLGNANLSLGQYYKAIAYYDSALVISRHISDRAGEGRHLGSLGNAYLSLDQYLQAIAYYDSALVICREIGNRDGEGTWLGNLGNAYLFLDQYPQAIAYYDSALIISRHISDRAGEERHLGNLGNAYRSLGQYRQAIAYHDSALVISRQIGDQQGETSSLGNLGNDYLSLSRYHQAIAYYDSALVISRHISDRAGEGRHLGSLGNAFLSLGQYYKAIAYHDSALVISREIGDRDGEGTCLDNLGNDYRSLSQHHMAIAKYDSALVISREIGDRQGEEDALGNLGKAYRFLGQYPQAIAYSDSALVISRQIGDQHGEGGHLSDLGNVYLFLGQHDRAIAYSDSALVINREIGDRQGEGACLASLGNASWSLGQYLEAIAYHDSALVISREIGDRAGSETHLGNLGTAYKSLGQYRQAIAYHDSALVISREIGDRAGEGIWLGNLGSIYLFSGQYDQARGYADSALTISLEIGNAEGIWRENWILARATAKLPSGKTSEVIKFYDDAAKTLEELTSQLSRDIHKQSYVETQQGFYADYVGYLIAQPEKSHHEKALEISEASRTRALRDLLQGQEIQAGLAVDKRVAAQKRMKELFAQATSAGVIPEQVKGQHRGGEDEHLEDWAARVQIPADTLASSETAPVIRLPQIVAEAKTHTLLEYHVLQDGVAIWVVNPQGQVFAHKQAIPREKLYALIDSARQALGVADFARQRRAEYEGVSQPGQAADYAPILKTLDSLLIQPLARYLPKDTSQQLIILPHDNLFVLPFACLMDSSGKYLVQRYTFSAAPSVGLLKFAKFRQRVQQYLEKPTLLLMGNPEMPDPKMWSSLTGAEKEVMLIAETVNLKKGKGFQAPEALPLRAMALTKKQATEAEFRQIAGIQNYVHLATHGYVVSNALRCGLVLAKTGNTMETDGILTTAEIFGLPLNAELVVLSACQTGLGQVSSDGVAGLSRAFLYAGAASLMVSLWKVDDAATQFLMVKFYEELARDCNKARALRAAQLATMKKYPAPSDWAAFVMVGQPKGIQ